jgi:hypothetical protein
VSCNCGVRKHLANLRALVIEEQIMIVSLIYMSVVVVSKNQRRIKMQKKLGLRRQGVNKTIGKIDIIQYTPKATGLLLQFTFIFHVFSLVWGADMEFGQDLTTLSSYPRSDFFF